MSVFRTTVGINPVTVLAFALTGPQGPAGATGPQGPAGATPTSLGSHAITTSQTDDATASRTLTDADHGRVLRFTSGSAVGVTVPNSLRSDFTCTVLQFGGGQVTFTGSSASIRNRQNHTKTAGQYAVVSMVKVASGEFVLVGDTAA